MTNRERALAVLRYQNYDRLPIVHFGFWRETLMKWANEGHISLEEAENQADGNYYDDQIAAKLGFDFNWQNMFYPNNSLMPPFEEKVIKTFPDGTRHVINNMGVVVVQKPDAGSIPSEIAHTLKDRNSWEIFYKHKYQHNPERVNGALVRIDSNKSIRFDRGGKEMLAANKREKPLGLHCGSLFGEIRNILGIEGTSYLYADDEKLFDEIINTVADLCYANTKTVLESGAKFDFGHFWEDICFKNGPLVIPSVFYEKVGPHYKRITDLLNKYGIDIVSLDCDGLIDALIPTWLDNGVNTMFPIEVGTWNASIKPWREKYGRKIKGVGGMNKTVFSRDKKNIDSEIERLKSLVELGGYIPCPDHRLAPDSKWELVCYYCERMRKVFS